ncbi:MAG: hypothetical protein V3V00_09990 [Saprospiraceae bacterium]
MYKYILEAAGNINWMALMSLMTFMFVFIVSAVLVFRKNNEHLTHMAHLPLEDDLLKD